MPFLAVNDRYSKITYTFGGSNRSMTEPMDSLNLKFRKGSMAVFAFSILSGLFIGSQFYLVSDSALFSLMRVSAGQNVSIISHLSVLLLPFLLSAFFYSTCTAWLIIPLSFLKGICFGFCQAIILSSFAGAGWLVYFFLMFSNILTLPVLVFFWISCISGMRHMIYRLFFCALIVFFVVAIDHRLIIPYYISLFT